MLLKPLVELLEFLYSLEDISFLRLDVISLNELNVLFCTKTSHGFSLDTTLPFNHIDLLLEHLLVFHVRVFQIFEIVLPAL